MVVLETTFLIDVLRGDPGVKEIVQALQDPLFIASPSIMEIWSGALQSTLPGKEKEKVEKLLNTFNTLPLDSKAAQEAGEIQAHLLKEGNPIDVEDIMIAGIVRSRGEKIITRDAHFARIPGLKIEKY